MADMFLVKVCESGCASEYQDRKYGKGRRVHNRTLQNKPEASRGWRCTQCGMPRRSGGK